MAGKKSKNEVLNEAPPMIAACAVIEVAHESINLDAAGRLTEIPELLEPFETLREAVAKFYGREFKISPHPFIKPGSYGFRLWETSSSQIENGIANRFHALAEIISHAWLSVVGNANSDRPMPFASIDVTEKQMAVLKPLGQIARLQVQTHITTKDGQQSNFPLVDSRYLAKPEIGAPDAEKFEGPITGLEFSKDSQPWVRINYARWLKIQFTSFSNLCEMAKEGKHVRGTAEVVDGAWTVRDGKFIDGPKNHALALEMDPIVGAENLTLHPIPVVTVAEEAA